MRFLSITVFKYAIYRNTCATNPRGHPDRILSVLEATAVPAEVGTIVTILTPLISGRAPFTTSLERPSTARSDFPRTDLTIIWIDSTARALCILYQGSHFLVEADIRQSLLNLLSSRNS